MSVNTTSLDLLLKEIEDPHVQENFYRLKLYLEQIATGNTTIVQGDTVTNVAGAVALKKVMSCDVSVNINDWVYQSTTVDNLAIAAVDHNPLKPVIGIVVTKPATTQCEVMFLGVTPFASGRGQLFLGITGQASDVAPSTGYIQKLGMGFGDGDILVRPEWTRILKT